MFLRMQRFGSVIRAVYLDQSTDREYVIVSGERRYLS